MGYALIWIETLGAALLLVAAALAARAAATRRRRLAMAGVVVAILVPMGAGLAVAASDALLAARRVSLGYSGYAMVWLVAFLAGCAWLALRGRREIEGRPQAAAWPSGKLLGGFALALLLSFMTILNLDATMMTQLSALRAEAGALAQSTAPPRLLDRDNAARLYEKAFESLQRGNERAPELKTMVEAASKDIGKPGFKASAPELREFLKNHQASLALLRRAVALPGCQFDRDWSQGIAMQLPELRHVRGCAGLLAVSARCKAAEGDLRGALEEVAAIRSLARHFGGEPLVISGLVTISTAAVGVDTLEGILRTTRPSAQDLAVLGGEDTFSYPRALRRCLATELAFGLSAFAMLSGDVDALPLSQSLGLGNVLVSVSLPLWRVFLMSDDLQSYRAYMNGLRDAAALSNKEWTLRVEELEKRVKGGIVTAMIMPSLSRVNVAFARAEAQQRLAGVAVALAAHRAKSGQFPAALENLVPEFLDEIPADPFDGKSIRYLVSGAGATLYSVGANETDEGGANQDPHKGDIVFRLGDAGD